MLVGVSRVVEGEIKSSDENMGKLVIFRYSISEDFSVAVSSGSISHVRKAALNLRCGYL